MYNLDDYYILGDIIDRRIRMKKIKLLVIAALCALAVVVFIACPEPAIPDIDVDFSGVTDMPII